MLFDYSDAMPAGALIIKGLCQDKVLYAVGVGDAGFVDSVHARAVTFCGELASNKKKL